MNRLEAVIPKKVKPSAEWESAGYWRLPNDVYVTENDAIVISIIDSAIDETLVVYWDEEHQTYFHTTNCFGLGAGSAEDTRDLIDRWCNIKAADNVDTK